MSRKGALSDTNLVGTNYPHIANPVRRVSQLRIGVSPEPPDSAPPTPKSDLRSHGFNDDDILRYTQAFLMLDADGDGFVTTQDLCVARPALSEDEASYILNQFAPANVNVDKIDLATFARTCEKQRHGAWSNAYAYARKELERGLAASDEPLEELLAEAGIEVTPAEAIEMAKILGNEALFLKAMGASSLPASPSKSSTMNKQSMEVAAGPKVGGMAAVFASIQQNGKTSRPGHRFGGESEQEESKTSFGNFETSSFEQSIPCKLPFHDGTGDPRLLPAAGPPLTESKFPPPTPPPLP